MSHDSAAEPSRTPAVSVCIPMYNNGTTIERCLRSVLGQSGVDFEIVVIDDDSTDDCADIASGLLRPQDRLVRNRPRLGLNGNHARCLELAEGDLIQIVHGDDWLLPGALETLAPLFDDPEVGLAFAPRQIDSDDVRWKQRYGTVHHRFRRLGERNRGSALVRQMVLHGAKENWIGEPTCVMFRRRVALDAGGFRADVYQLVDVDFWTRLMLRSTVCFVPQQLSVRSHTTATATTRLMATRRNLLDQHRILTWMMVDPAAPRGVRLAAAVWWLPAWLSMLIEVAVLGPQRWSHVKTLSSALFGEFGRARRFRDRLECVDQQL